MDNAIETHDLVKRYGNVTAVDRLSLQVDRAEIYAFLGLNGAGKTTTIRLLLGMVKPTAGEAIVLGSKIRPGEKKPWNAVGYMVETADAYPELTVRENLEAMRRLRPGCPQKLSRMRLNGWDWQSTPGEKQARYRMAMPNGWDWRKRCCTNPTCSSWMSQPTVWTQPASSKSATCCMSWFKSRA